MTDSAARDTAGGSSLAERQDRPLIGWFDDFLTARATRKPAENTLAAYRRDLVGVARLLAEQASTPLPRYRLDQADRTALRAAFAAYARDRAAASVARAWSTWNQLYNWLVADEVVAGNPMRAVDRPRVARGRPKALAGEDTPERLLAAVATGATGGRDPWPERDLLILALGLVCGLRLSEMLTLVIGSLAGRPGERRLQVEGKGGKPRSVPVEAPLELLLDLYLASRRRRFPRWRPARTAALLVDRRNAPLRRGGLQYVVRQSYRRAGVHDRVSKGALVHALRHTFATRLAEDGATVAEIMVLLGHGSIVTSQTYIDATGREQRAAVAANRTYRVLADIAADADRA